MTATACSCLITGPLLIIGSVFCVYPTFTYVAAQMNQHPNQHLQSGNGRRRQEKEEVEEEPIDEEERRELYAALIREEPMRRIEPSNGKWQLSITETSCDPSFLWDRPQPKGKVSQATRRFVTKDYVNPNLRNNCIFCNGKHKPDECPHVVSVEDRRDILALNERCIRCLRRHRDEPCPKKNRIKDNVTTASMKIRKSRSIIHPSAELHLYRNICWNQISSLLIELAIVISWMFSERTRGNVHKFGWSLMLQ
ncbi:hypothetical protein GCK72_012827 [Caenorhabditis remanei]|uniref:Uncharacterized protein n=1 Tax=Caenorhabditis remanei TaxID=31234 RepID=A0A6A5GP06_CAERE|nr:hypothetical protein GCK72_012827 [Caenorhabditis remanei]KAF1756374.1 hypothetical protein GCK72_012827 [Caenorhabditis remanei]